MKGSVLELGGKDPQIVCADADLANAISGCVWGGFANAGPDLLGDRAHLRRRARSPTASSTGVRRETERLTVGDPLDWETEIGPMVSADQFDIVTELVDDALAAGAERLTGGPREVAGFTRQVHRPDGARRASSDEMRIMQRGDLRPGGADRSSSTDEEEALERANDSNFGLGASVWTRDRAKGERMARRIESGMVWINDHSYTHGALQCSWGGVKDSGLGRSHSKFGFYECVERQARRLGAGPHPRLLVAALRRRPSARPCAPRRACSTAATATG